MPYWDGLNMVYDHTDYGLIGKNDGDNGVAPRPEVHPAEFRKAYLDGHAIGAHSRPYLETIPVPRDVSEYLKVWEIAIFVQSTDGQPQEQVILGSSGVFSPWRGLGHVWWSDGFVSFEQFEYLRSFESQAVLTADYTNTVNDLQGAPEDLYTPPLPFISRTITLASPDPAALKAQIESNLT